MKSTEADAAAGPAPGEEAALRALAEQEDLRFLEAVPETFLDPSLVERLPVDWARTHRLLPVRDESGAPCVLTADPLAVDEQEHLALLVGEVLCPIVTPPAAIADCIEQCYYRREESASDVLGVLSAQSAAAPAAERSSDLLQGVGNAPVAQLVNVLLLNALRQGASDIHIEPFHDRLLTRYRVDGVLYAQDAPPKPVEQALVSRLKVMAGMDIAERRLPQDGMARVRVGEREIDIRVSTVPVTEGERVVLRLLDRDATLLPLSALGMPEGMHARFSALLDAGDGIVIVCGPTGSGKTTTLYAALRMLDAEHANILTIEDPVEYRLTGIGQIQVKPKIGLSFADGLRHILRQDPDVVLVGETRDLETAEIAVRASLTGHLVFTTLHTNDAPGSVVRLVDMGIPAYLVASSLRGVLAQRLVRRLCPHCRSPVPANELPPAVAEALAAAGATGAEGWEAGGCARCMEGYRGRTGVFELMEANETIRDRIRRGGRSASALREVATAQGMTGMLGDALTKMRQGVTSVSEVAELAASFSGR